MPVTYPSTYTEFSISITDAPPQSLREAADAMDAYLADHPDHWFEASDEDSSIFYAYRQLTQAEYWAQQEEARQLKERQDAAKAARDAFIDQVLQRHPTLVVGSHFALSRVMETNDGRSALAVAMADPIKTSLQMRKARGEDSPQLLPNGEELGQAFYPDQNSTKRVTVDPHTFELIEH